MGLILLVAFIATPIAEIAIFIEAGERFGLWPTLGAVILTAFFGTGLLCWQGLTTWCRAAASLQQGVFPINEIFAGLCLVAAGALLLTPGFLTDAVGFALFVPYIRHLIEHLIKRAMTHGGGSKVWVNGQPMNRDDKMIDGEYEARETPRELDKSSGAPNPDSPWQKRP